MEAQWFNVAEQAFSQYSFTKKLWVANYLGVFLCPEI
jgi:hypothetical protein